MHQVVELAERGLETRRYRQVLYLCQALVVVIVAGVIVTPGPARTVIGGVALLLMTAVQYFISRLLGNKSVDLILSHETLMVEAEAARHRTEELFEMTDMLQSAVDHVDAGAVLRATTLRLLPEFRGALYVFNNSRDRLDLATSWSPDEDFLPADTLVPDNCWALKRGNPHINDPALGTLCCLHHSGDLATMELPMVARGSVYGLLMLATGDGAARLESAARVARALADSMSLALSNIALRERLRTQSMRDPLTGLYNRRYMEDALDRYLSMAMRNRESTSVIMIDLDNFKALNDTHGHAKGDAVLCDVAAQLVGALRPADVVSRYGGEELLVILPGCKQEDAMLEAEVLRGRIESLSEAHGITISASFGVASVPETSSGRADLIPLADTALYAAKKSGRNCVRAAESRGPRGGNGESSPRLAVA